VEALEAEWQKAQEHTSQTPASTGPTNNKQAAPEPPTLDELRKLHQKYEKHEEQVERAQQKVDKCEAQIAQLQEELEQHKAHLDGRRAARDAAKKAFDEADLRHRVERPVGTLAEDSEYYDVSQIVAATAWVAAKAKTAGQEKPPREIRRTYRSLRQVWNSFGPLDFDSSSDEEEDEEEHEDEVASARDDAMEGKSGNSTPKGGSTGPGSPMPEEGTVSGGKPRLDQDTGERLAKSAKTENREGVGPLATSYHQRYPPPTPPALILPRVTSRKGGRTEGRGVSPSRSRSPVPSYRSPAEASDSGRDEPK
jgi:uncharacterized small protein (DUF1192 family)